MYSRLQQISIGMTMEANTSVKLIYWTKSGDTTQVHMINAFPRYIFEGDTLLMYVNCKDDVGMI